MVKLGMFTSSDSLRGISTEVAPDMMTVKNLVATKLKLLNCQSQRRKLLEKKRLEKEPTVEYVTHE